MSAWSTLLLATLTAAPQIGERPIRVEAPRLAFDQKTGLATYSGGATVDKGSTHLTCDSLVATSNASRTIKTISAQGHVVARDKNLTASGDTAVFDDATGLLTVTGNPQVEQVDARSQKRVYGESIVFSPSKNVAVVQKARTHLTQAGKQPTEVTIEADVLEVDGAKDTALWKGHVLVRRGALTVRANEMVATSNQAGIVTQLVATGGVEAFEGDKWAKGKQATYQAATSRLVLTGAPEARVGTNRMRGTRVTFLVDKNVFDVENAVTILDVSKAQQKAVQHD